MLKDILGTNTYLFSSSFISGFLVNLLDGCDLPKVLYCCATAVSLSFPSPPPYFFYNKQTS